jgi:uncharacterized protein (TIGR03792 family)
MTPVLHHWLSLLLGSLLGRPLRQLLAAALAAALLLAGVGPAPAATSGSGDYGVVVVEHLRVKVPADAVDAWLEAEQGSWEPWLAAQPGFLDRQLLWDAEQEEGTLLIHWRSRDQWKAISEEEIEQVQERFEELARKATGRRQGNPFPLVFEGELLPR